MGTDSMIRFPPSGTPSDSIAQNGAYIRAPGALNSRTPQCSAAASARAAPAVRSPAVTLNKYGSGTARAVSSSNTDCSGEATVSGPTSTGRVGRADLRQHQLVAGVLVGLADACQ